MKTIKKIHLVVLVIFITWNIQSQQKFTIKTTELYKVNSGYSFGEFQHLDMFVTWELDLENNKINYTAKKIKKTFNFFKSEINRHSTESRKIFKFEGREEALTMIIDDKNNYIKIKIYYDKIPGSKPVRHKKVNVYSNYSMNSFNEILKD